ncbi:MAG TPA: hypothetical protein VKB49_01720 [Candidatus Sulfotelmatobacter sp.]|nr:hypothetical protein [Candidatus Sulfotelmatobacter sp.]
MTLPLSRNSIGIAMAAAPIPSYEIFSGKFGYTEVLWLESIEGLGNAFERMKEIAKASPGPYFLFCNRTHRKMAAIDTSVSRSRPASDHQEVS